MAKRIQNREFIASRQEKRKEGSDDPIVAGLRRKKEAAGRKLHLWERRKSRRAATPRIFETYSAKPQNVKKPSLTKG